MHLAVKGLPGAGEVQILNRKCLGLPNHNSRKYAAAVERFLQDSLPPSADATETCSE